jgi:Tol biopolymer transport system component
MANTIVVQTLASGDEVAFPVSISIPIFARFCWSSDNRRVFFSGWDKDRKSHVYQLNRSTGAISKMTEDPVLGNAFVSADGKSIFYSSGDGKEGAIIRREVADGSERKLFSDAAIISLGALSPDGKFLAFRWMPLPVREGSSEKRMERVFFLSTDGGDPRVLLENKGEEHVFIQLGWTHDGKNVLVSKRGLNYQDRLWIVPLDGSGPRQTEVVGNMLRSFSLRSEDGSMIYADGSLSADNEIWALENFWPPKPARKRP